jgi:quercetin dioxygenase-like cupin family protein
MAYKGQILDNRVTGERFTFLETAEDTNGELLALELEVTPEGHVPGTHVHPVQEERFEVLEGELTFRKGLSTVVGGAGDVVIVPPGTAHRFANSGRKRARVRVEVRPALKMEQLFEVSTALANEGRTLYTGMPKPLELSLFMSHFKDEVEAPIAPKLVRHMMAPLVRLAVNRGLNSRYERKSRPTAATGPGPMRPSERSRPGRRSILGEGIRPAPSRP